MNISDENKKVRENCDCHYWRAIDSTNLMLLITYNLEERKTKYYTETWIKYVLRLNFIWKYVNIRSVRNHTVHRGAFCQFHIWWICYSSKSTGYETGKMHLCALGDFSKFSLVWVQSWFFSSIKFSKFLKFSDMNEKFHSYYVIWYVQSTSSQILKFLFYWRHLKNHP